jgi:hypothetical protein
MVRDDTTGAKAREWREVAPVVRDDARFRRTHPLKLSPHSATTAAADSRVNSLHACINYQRTTMYRQSLTRDMTERSGRLGDRFWGILGQQCAYCHSFF